MKAQISAVEIVIGMFILVVVAFALIQVFRSFMGQQTQQFQDIVSEEQVQRSKELSLQKCRNLCQTAEASSCADLDIAKFCLEQVEVDYNGDGKKETRKFGNDAGIYSCEMPVYCFQMTDCNRCGVGSGVQGARKCKDLLCAYWQGQGITGDQLNGIAANNLKPGECLDALENRTSTHWFVLAFNSTNATCR